MYSLITIVFLVICVALSISSKNVSPAELTALRDLYYGTNGPYWRWTKSNASQWNFSVADPNPCTPRWQGLLCNCDLPTPTKTCYIYEIHLNHRNMTGQLSPSIGNFAELVYFDISGNSIHGTLPDSLGNLTSLVYFVIENNHNITGTIPSTLGNLKHLRNAYFGYNRLTGTLPQELFQLTELVVFDVNTNQLNGSIPSTIGNLVNLKRVNFNLNEFTGTIPSTIGNLVNLTYIDLIHNNLNGTIPEEFCQMTRLKSFDWSDNLLRGSIPACMGHMPKLYSIYLAENDLTGSIPDTFQFPLAILVVSNNDLTGSIPSKLLNGLQMRILLLNSNRLTGTIPRIELPDLWWLDLGSNHLWGGVDGSFTNTTNANTNYTHLFTFIIQDNDFDGSVPESLGSVQTLESFNIANNQFTGTISYELTRRIVASDYYVDYNQLTGTLPENYCDARLRSLEVNNNFFTGSIPLCLFTDTLEYLSASENIFSGPIVSVNQSFHILQTFVVNDNVLTGSLPFINNASKLVFFYVQNNQLEGTVPLGNLNSLEYVDLSNNQFSGTLPRAFFNSSSALKSFAASSNCFTGSIPEEICSVPGLSVLDLDGLTTAHACRQSIFTGLPYFNSYYLQQEVADGIPSCLFDMTNINTLHVSGNSIEWSFPSDLTISPSLQTLSLSHNKLYGTIPAAIQQRQWLTLDLSYNRLVGEVSVARQWNNKSSLVLQVNRLSGIVPESVMSMSSINILNGNLFGCDLERTSLPKNDVTYTTYQCGSNSFNQASIIWISFAGVAVCLAIIAWYFRFYWWAQFLVWFKGMWSKYLEYVEVFEDKPENKRLFEYQRFVLTFRNIIVSFTVGIVVVFLPLYAALTVYYKTAFHQYAWTGSAAFLSGITPAMVLLGSYISVIVVLFLLWLKYRSKSSVVITAVQHSSVLQVLALPTVVLFNCVIMIIVNAVYVGIILNYRSSVIFAAQVFTALFKLLWNDYAVRVLVTAVRSTESVISSDDKRMSARSAVKRDDDRHIATEMPYMTFIILFNSILAPCLATAAVDTNCFYNVLQAPSAVAAKMPISTASVSCTDICRIVVEPTSIEVTYDPPFIYGYQCTSSLLTNYASVYVFMFLMVAFIKPLVLYSAVKLHTYISSSTGTLLNLALERVMNELLRPARTEDLTTRKVLFHRERFVLRMIGKISVFITFGVIFPPLAVVLCVAFVSECYMNLTVMGRFLVNVKDEAKRKQFKELLSRDCEGCAALLISPLVKLVVPFAALFYAFYVFDVYGDAVGATKAVWASCLIIMTPPLLWAGYILIGKARTAMKTRGRNRQKAVDDGTSVTEVVELSVLHYELQAIDSQEKLSPA